uniref:Amine oxidase domain-containing protein n=1 Tax=Setaria italica TaxID=4555 RepID=K4AJR7_SETIT
IPYGPTRPVDMVIDYYMNDYEFAEPPRVTSVQNAHRLPTFAKFAENVYFVIEQRGYESVVHYIAGLNAVQEITYSQDRVTVKTEDGLLYEADYVMVSVSLGVLQSNLITFNPPLPVRMENLSNYKFYMAVYTKMFLKFPKKYWLVGSGIEFFLYASSRRGHYPIWQGKKPHLENEYPGSSILLITITDDESRRIEQQSYEQTKAEATEVLRKMFPDRDVPNATDIFVPWWWSDKFFKGSFSNWPIGVNGYEYDQIRDPVERVHFMGEHASEHYNGYVHGAYLAGLDF